MMDKLDEVLAKITSALAEAATKHGPEAGKLLLEVKRIEAIQNIANGLTLFVIAGICYSVSAYLRRRIAELRKRGINTISDENQRDSYVVVMLISLFMSFFATAGMLVHLASIITWIGVFKPEVYLASQLMDKILK